MKLKLNRQPRLPVLSAERFGAKKDDVNYEEALQDLSLIFLGNGDDIGKYHLQGSNVFGKREVFASTDIWEFPAFQAFPASCYVSKTCKVEHSLNKN